MVIGAIGRGHENRTVEWESPPRRSSSDMTVNTTGRIIVVDFEKSQWGAVHIGQPVVAGGQDRIRYLEIDPSSFLQRLGVGVG